LRFQFLDVVPDCWIVGGRAGAEYGSQKSAGQQSGAVLEDRGATSSAEQTEWRCKYSTSACVIRHPYSAICAWIGSHNAHAIAGRGCPQGAGRGQGITGDLGHPCKHTLDLFRGLTGCWKILSAVARWCPLSFMPSATFGLPWQPEQSRNAHFLSVELPTKTDYGGPTTLPHVRVKGNAIRSICPGRHGTGSRGSMDSDTVGDRVLPGGYV
jgi:hypothetical protein